MAKEKQVTPDNTEIERSLAIWTGFSHLVRYSIYSAAAILFALLAIFIM